MKRKVGKPRLYANEITTPVTTALPPSLRAKMVVLAAKDGVSLSRAISYSCERLIGARKTQQEMGLI